MSTPFAQAVVIGGSAGGLQALTTILSGLPADYPLPIFVTIHIPANRKNLLAELLRTKCALAVHEAEDKQPIRAGTVYVAPPNYHLLIETGGTLSLSSDEPVLYSRPAIDVLFESAADVYGDSLVGIVLSGANNDGAKGLKAIQDAGGIALVQDPTDAYAATMPQAALTQCTDSRILSLSQLADYLQHLKA